MAESALSKLTQREVSAVKEYLQDLKTAKWRGAKKKLGEAGAELSGEADPPDMSFEEAKVRVRAIEILGRLDATDQLRQQENSRYAREMKRTDASVYRSTVMLATGLADAETSLKIAKIGESAAFHNMALERREADGWTIANDWDTQTLENAQGAYGDYFDWDASGAKTRTGKSGYVIKVSEERQRAFYTQLARDIVDIGDDRQRAFYIETVEQTYGRDIWKLSGLGKEISGSPGLAKRLVAAVTAAQDAKADAQAVDVEARVEMKATWNEWYQAGGSSVRPELLDYLKDARGKLDEEVDLSVGTHRPPPDKDASDREKQKWVEEYTFGKMMIDPANGSVVAVDVAERKGVQPITYERLTQDVVVDVRDRPYAETAKDYIVDLLDTLGSDDPSAREVKEKFKATSDDFKNYVVSRGFADEDVALKAYVNEAKANLSARKLTDKEITRQNILSGQADATPGQYRRAAIGAAIRGPADSKTMGRDPLGTVGKILAAPIALPAAALAGGVQGLRNLARKRGLQEPTEAQPEAPIGAIPQFRKTRTPQPDGVIAQVLSDLRDKVDAGEIDEEQFKAVESALGASPYDPGTEKEWGGKMKFRYNVPLPGEPKTGKKYSWEVTVDTETGELIGPATVLPGSVNSEGKTFNVGDPAWDQIVGEYKAAMGITPDSPWESWEKVDPETGFLKEQYDEWQLGEEDRPIAEPVPEPGVADPGWVAPPDPAQKEAEAEAKGLDLEPGGEVRVDPMQAELREKQVVALTEAALAEGIISADEMNKILVKFREDPTIPILGEGNSLETALFGRAETPEEREVLEGALIAVQNLEDRAQAETTERAKFYEDDEAPQIDPVPAEGTEEDPSKEFKAYSERLEETAGKTGRKLASEIKAQKDREALLRELKRPEGLEEMTEKEYGKQKKVVKKTARQVKKGAKKVERLESKAKKPGTKKKAEKEKEKEQERAQRKFAKGKPSARQ